MYILDIDADDDYLFECFVMVTNGSTKRYLEAALDTKTQAGRSVTDCQSTKAFYQSNRSIPTL